MSTSMPGGDISAPDRTRGWIVIGWFTPDYAGLAHRLADSLAGQMIPHHFYAKDPAPGGWLADCRRKPDVLLSAFADHPGHEIVLVDVDLDIHGDIDELLATPGDVVVHGGTKRADAFPWRKRKRRLHLTSRVMVWKATPAALRLAHRWYQECQKPGIVYGDETAFLEAYAASVGVAVACMDARFGGHERSTAPAGAVITHHSAHDQRLAWYQRSERLIRRTLRPKNL